MGVQALADLPGRPRHTSDSTLVQEGWRTGWWLGARYYALWQSRLWARSQEKFPEAQKKLDLALLSRTPAVQGVVREVPRVRATFADFLRIVSTASTPVILDGSAADSWSPPSWTLDSLVERCGDTELKFVERDGSGGIRTASMDLAGYVQEIRRGENRYIAASAKLFADNAELMGEFPLEEIKRLTRRHVVRIEAFIGAAGMGSSFHCAGIGNLFCQVYGQKKWTMVPPAYSKYMYPMVGELPYTIYVNSPIRSASYDEQREQYPLYDFVPKYTATLGPGDILFNPSWWWHEVANVGETIGVPIRLMPSWRFNKPFSALTLSSLPFNVGALADVGRSLAKTRMYLKDSGSLHDVGAKSINLD